MAGINTAFAVVYDDGRSVTIYIDRWTISRDDFDAKTVAEEKQRDGFIPQGAIKSVTRAPVTKRPRLGGDEGR
jgi:hypothetical protein